MTTVVSPDGTVEENEFGPGDTWYFPRGYGHALQGLGPGECHFLLGFDNGDFSEFGTFSITDWISRTPRPIVARNMQLPESVVAGLPTGESVHRPGQVPTFGEPFRNPNVEPSQLTHKYRLGGARAAAVRGRGRAHRVVGGVPDSDDAHQRANGPRTRLVTGDALASQLGRVAVLHEGPGSRRRLRRPRPCGNGEVRPGGRVLHSAGLWSLDRADRGRGDSARHPVQQP